MDVKLGDIIATIKFWINFFTTWRKAIRRVWKIPYRTHNKLVHLINKSCSINSVLE